MSAFRMLLVPAALFSVAVSSPVATAITNGVIHFKGAIVESPCNVNVDTRHATVVCDREGEAKSRQFPLKYLAQGQRNYANLVMMKINYLNPARTLAVMDITYN